jgi:preprotein translocase subunit SecA
MSKKKSTPKPASKAARVKAATAANPGRAEDVAQPPKAPKAADAARPAPQLPFRRPVSFNFAGVGRNDICPCGSGKRFKNCHGN